MKKPVILLIDDDSSVLETLELLLTPAFGARARVEAYTCPREALAQTPRWEQENRQLALAVVDQKMPGLSGTTLVALLRKTAPGKQLQALLLTGFAGLDNAIRAKNEARIDAYFEKPWQREQLLAALRRLFDAFLRSSGLGRHYLMREAQSDIELEALLRLRYRVFRLSAAASLSPPNPDEIDVDPHDPRARHLGLYRMEPGSESKAVGYLRVVTGQEEKAQGLLTQLAGRFPSIAAALQDPPPEPFPLLAYYPQAGLVRDLIEALRAKGHTLVEPGRLALDTSERSRTLARTMIESIFAILASWNISHAVVTCMPPQHRFYLPLGFEIAPGTGLAEIPAHGISAYCLLGAAAAIPSPAAERVQVHAARFREHGFTCACPSLPECLSSSPDFFCPRSPAVL